MFLNSLHVCCRTTVLIIWARSTCYIIEYSAAVKTYYSGNFNEHYIQSLEFS